MKLELTFHKSGNVNLARMAKATHEQFGYRVADTFPTQRPFVPM